MIMTNKNLKIYNRECDDMTDISGIFSISSSTKHQWISLCGHLEAVIGNYFLSQAGNPGAYWYAIYYDSSVDGYNECVEITDKNLTRISKNSPTSIGGEMNCHLLHSAIVGM